MWYPEFYHSLRAAAGVGCRARGRFVDQGVDFRVGFRAWAVRGNSGHCTDQHRRLGLI